MYMYVHLLKFQLNIAVSQLTRLAGFRPQTRLYMLCYKYNKKDDTDTDMTSYPVPIRIPI